MCVFFFTSSRWEPTSICRSCTGRNRVMFCVSCCVFAPGSIASCHPFTEHLAHLGQTRQGAWDIVLSKVSFKAFGFITWCKYVVVNEWLKHFWTWLYLDKLWVQVEHRISSSGAKLKFPYGHIQIHFYANFVSWYWLCNSNNVQPLLSTFSEFHFGFLLELILSFFFIQNNSAFLSRYHHGHGTSITK